MLSRRRMLHGLAGAMAATAALRPGLSLASLPGDKRLVVVILRGGVDGLAAVPPHGDPAYRRAHDKLALAGPGGKDGLLDLDGHFGLHPSLKVLHEMYRDGDLLAVHAAAVPYRARSHVDGQDVLETGTARPGGARDGWLNRALRVLDPAREPGLGLALGESVPLILRGPARVASWSPNVLPLPEPALLEEIAHLWRHDALLGPALAEGLRLQDPDKAAMTHGRGLRGLYGPRGIVTYAEKAGRMLAEPDGPRIAVLEMGGWDTHANQGLTAGRLANHLSAFGDGMGELKAALGGQWAQTAVLAVSEFGRTAAPNGTGGTDHGVAGAALLLGGAVAGGRVRADWPGLAAGQLYEGRDLRPTTDLRALFKAALRDHLGVDPTALETEVFPESRAIRSLEGLFSA